MKIPSSILGRTCCVQKLFRTFRTIFVHNVFSPCSAKRRASDKDLPVQHIISITCNYVDCCLTFLGKVFIDLRSPGGDGRWQQRWRQVGRRRLRGRPSLSSKGFSFFEEIWNKRETYCKSCIALCRSSVLSTFNFGVY